jgi:hypothetical protein
LLLIVVADTLFLFRAWMEFRLAGYRNSARLMRKTASNVRLCLEYPGDWI